jgi:xanthine phosphoribosyltransferase
MKDFPDLPIVSPEQSIQVINTSSLSPAQKLLSIFLITQSRVFHYHLKESAQDLLVLDVTYFLNHRIHTKLIDDIGRELAKKIEQFNPELILTAPSSGNIPSIATALHLPNTPDIIYAPKGMPITMTDVYQSKSRSYTQGKSVDLTVAKNCLAKNTRVVICDDFLDTGRTGIDLVNIVNQANAQTVALMFVIEKPFGGRDELVQAGFTNDQIISLISIESMQPGKLKLKGFDAWFELIRK